MASLCPLCAGPVDQEKVICARCETPHHEACFTFWQADRVGCGIYACASDVYQSNSSMYQVTRDGIAPFTGVIEPSEYSLALVPNGFGNLPSTQPFPFRRVVAQYHHAYLSGSQPAEIGEMLLEEICKNHRSHTQIAFMTELADTLEDHYRGQQESDMPPHQFYGALGGLLSFAITLPLCPLPAAIFAAGGAYYLASHLYQKLPHKEWNERIIRSKLKASIEGLLLKYESQDIRNRRGTPLLHEKTDTYPDKE